MGRFYATKVDWWIGLILLLAVAVLIGIAVLFFVGPLAQTPLGPAIGMFCLVLAVWTGWTPFNTYYEIDQTELVIRCAGFRWRVPLDSIVEVFPTHNPLSDMFCNIMQSRLIQMIDSDPHVQFTNGLQVAPGPNSARACVASSPKRSAGPLRAK